MANNIDTGLEVIKLFIMINLKEHAILTNKESKILKIRLSCLEHSDVIFVLLMHAIVGILICMSRVDFMLSSVKYQNSLITSGPFVTLFAQTEV